MKNLIKSIILFSLLFNNMSFAETKNISKLSGKSKRRRARSKTELMDQYFSLRLKDYQKIISTEKNLRRFLVSYFGKSQKAYIVDLLKKFTRYKLPEVLMKQGYYEINGDGKKVKFELESLLLQKFKVNSTLSFQLRSFESLESFLEYLIPKFEVLINTSEYSPITNFLINKAHAQNYKTQGLAFSTIVLALVMVHGKSNSCSLDQELFTWEIDEYENDCLQQLRNINPSNIAFIKNIFIKMTNIKQYTYLSNPANLCKEFGEYIESENSISCGFNKKLQAKNNRLCAKIKNLVKCVDNLSTAVENFN